MRKKESSLMIDSDFESILAPENNGKQNMCLLQLNIKIVFLIVMVTSHYVLMINLTNLLSHI